MLKRKVREQANVLLLNNEDDEDELKRKIAGICQHYSIPNKELTNRLFVRSGYGSRLLVARRTKDGGVIATPDTERLIKFCERYNIGAIVFDPLVSIHDVPENDNTDIESVMTEIRAIAKKTGAAILLIHHTKKTGGDSEAHAGDTEAGRGASALIGAARASFTLARMSKKSAENLGIDWQLGNRLIRMDDGKVNFALKDDKTDWYKMVSVTLPNGDSVGVPEPFDISDIAKRKAKEKEEAKTEEQIIKVTEIAAIVANGMTEDALPQPEVISAYRAKTGKKETASKGDVSMLPVGRENALSIRHNGEFTKIWRERIGTDSQPRYNIHRFIDY